MDFWDLVQEFQQRHSNILNQRILSLSLCLSVSFHLSLFSHNKDLQNTCHLLGTVLGTLYIFNHLIFTTTLWDATSNIPIFPWQNWGTKKLSNWSKWNSQGLSLGNLVPEFKLFGTTLSCLPINGTVLGGMHVGQEHKYLGSRKIRRKSVLLQKPEEAQFQGGSFKLC